MSGDPEGLARYIAEVAKVPVSVIENLRTVWMASRRFNAVMTWLSAFGLSPNCP